jgi:hypothetical protein
MPKIYTPEQSIIITSIVNFSVLLSLHHNNFYQSNEFKNILLANPQIDGNFVFSTLNDSGFFNEGSLPTILYTLLVYPKEAADELNCNDYINEMNAINLKLKNGTYNLTMIQNDYPDLVNRDLLQHIRNAISHAKIEFKNDAFIFTDKNTRRNVEISFSIHKNDIGIFIQDLYNAILLIIKEIQNTKQTTP